MFRSVKGEHKLNKMVYFLTRDGASVCEKAVEYWKKSQNYIFDNLTTLTI